MSTSVLSSVMLIEDSWCFLAAWLLEGSESLISSARAACSPWLVAGAFPFYSHQPQNIACSPCSCSCRLLPWEWFSRHNLWNLFHVILCVWGIGHCAFPSSTKGSRLYCYFFLLTGTNAVLIKGSFLCTLLKQRCSCRLCWYGPLSWFSETF